MNARRTRQGLRDLGGNHRPTKRCHHNFEGPSVVVGHRYEIEDGDFEPFLAPVYGKRCVWCGETRGGSK